MGFALEDQEFPKKCGHTPSKRVVPAQDMAEKIKVAAEARSDKDNFLIIARTDARAREGVDAALKRLEAYVKAGADILFFEAPEFEDEMRTACAHFDKPKLANMADGGKTPYRARRAAGRAALSVRDLPVDDQPGRAAAMKNALAHLKASDVSQTPAIPIYNFKKFCERIGFDEVWAFEKRWARP